LYLETELRTRLNIVWLAADQPEDGERHANDAMAGWSHKGFHRQHYTHIVARTQTRLYCGQAEAAWQLVAESWPIFERTHLLRARFLLIEASYLRARAALLNAAEGRDVARFLSVARKDARRIGRVGLRWPDAIATILRAAVAALEGRAAEGRDLLAAAVTAFERAEMRLHAAVARRRLGVMQHDERGRAQVNEADTWMAAHGVTNPARMARLIAPGFPDPPDL
jgi:hypothetical protein